MSTECMQSRLVSQAGKTVNGRGINIEIGHLSGDMEFKGFVAIRRFD